MLRYSLLANIYLLTSFVVLCYGEHIYESLTWPKEISSDSIISADSRDGSFAIADVINDETLGDPGIILRIENWKTNHTKECQLRTSRLGTATVGVSSLRRLEGNGDKVVVVWHDAATNNSNRQSRVTAVDMEDCHELGRIRLDRLRTNPIVIPASDGGYHVFLESKKDCASGGRCIITFNSNFELRSRKAFPGGYKWSSVYVEKLDNGKFLTRGWKDFETYQVAMISVLGQGTTKSKELMRLIDADRRIEVVSSGLSVCWLANQKDNSTVTCSQFNDDGQLIFTKDKKFNVAVKPLAVRSMYKGELFLLVGKSDCSDEKECCTMKWALVFQIPFEHSNIPGAGEEEFCCTGDRKSLVITDFWPVGEGRVNYGYTCKRENRYAYKKNTFEMFYDEDDPQRPEFGCFKSKNGWIKCWDPVFL